MINYKPKVKIRYFIGNKEVLPSTGESAKTPEKKKIKKYNSILEKIEKDLIDKDE